ncbi:27289_t:CDS:2 [Dentiscutata erythropus]|uniref:27289_t:CDS:1 n=1 Tax=Dentiscutata erythropus TaxID=1348616 RepID=A0A9N8ZP59_9GLOM|nr:27289_t:CDS:2 [Dentiscutata erythropus]
MSNSEPQMTGKHFKYVCEQRMRDVDDYFKTQQALKWSFELYINNFLVNPNLDISFDQLLKTFVDSLDQINQLHAIPVSLRSNCNIYINWLQSSPGKTLVNACREVFNAKIELIKNAKLNSKSVHITAQTKGLKTFLRPGQSETELSSSSFPSETASSPEAELSPSVLPSVSSLSPSGFFPEAELPPSVLPSETESILFPLLPTNNIPLPLSNISDSSNSLPKTPPQTPRELAHLLNTPNKRPIEKEELWHYTQTNFVIYAFTLTKEELNVEIGTKLSEELSFMRERNPVIWNSALEEYLDTTLNESGNKFKDLLQLRRRWPYYETFLTLDIDWIEFHSRLAKILKSESNSGIVLVDAKATRHFDGQDIWHLEVAGSPCNATDKHILGNSKKTFQTDILNLISILREHLDCEIELATKIKVFSTQSINTRLTLHSLNLLPNGRFLSCELASADEIVRQEILLEEINKQVIRSKKVTVRQADLQNYQ